LNAAPPMARPGELEPAPDIATTELDRTPEQVEYTLQLGEFLAFSSQYYTEAGDAQKAAEFNRASESLSNQNAVPALAELYLYCSSLELQIQNLERRGNADPAQLEAEADKFDYFRGIFIDNCRRAYPDIPMIGRETVDPSPAKAIDGVDRASNDLVVRLAETLAKDAPRQLNVDVMELYRLQVLRDRLEIEIRKGGEQPMEAVTAPELADSAPISPEENEADEDLHQKVEAGYQRLKLADAFKITLDQWMADDLRDSPLPHIYGDEPENLKKWRTLDTGLDDIRKWHDELKPEEKADSRHHLLKKLDHLFSKL
jgi:hypothetical protein